MNGEMRKQAGGDLPDEHARLAHGAVADDAAIRVSETQAEYVTRTQP